MVIVYTHCNGCFLTLGQVMSTQEKVSLLGKNPSFPSFPYEPLQYITHEVNHSRLAMYLLTMEVSPTDLLNELQTPENSYSICCDNKHKPTINTQVMYFTQKYHDI